MPRKLLKSKPRKIVAKSATAKNLGSIVVIGNYKERQLAWIEKNGIYNWPVREDDTADDGGARTPAAPCGEDFTSTLSQVKELWLYASAKSARHVFSAEFVGKMTNAEFLAAYPSYADLGPSKQKAYYVFKAKTVDYPSELGSQTVLARTADFGKRCIKVKKAVEQFKTDGEFAPLAAYLPKELAAVPRPQLRVCEAAVQMDFLNSFLKTVSGCDTDTYCKSDIVLECGDSIKLCEKWDSPTVIVSDGPYGLASYPGDPPTPEGLADFYRPFLEKWYRLANTSATLWFWNSEQGWANCHRVIEECGWEFRNCHIWDKGISHVAGNCNTKTIRKYPVVTEVCAQYVRKNYLKSQGVRMSLRDWMREEWKRTALPFRLTNVACGVKDAATRKYFSLDHLWYFPPSEAFVQIAAYANAHGRVEGRPFFAREDGGQFTEAEWELMRAKFHCEIGVSNVWNLPAVRGDERIKTGSSCLHMNQKPLLLLERIIRSSSDVGDVVWEPFGGLCSTAIAAYRTHRKAFAAEINPVYFNAAKERLNNE